MMMILDQDSFTFLRKGGKLKRIAVTITRFSGNAVETITASMDVSEMKEVVKRFQFELNQTD